MCSSEHKSSDNMILLLENLNFECLQDALPWSMPGLSALAQTSLIEHFVHRVAPKMEMRQNADV